MFSRAFSSQVQPVELARKLAKEMDAHRTASVSRVYVPNQYTVWLSAEDRQRLEGYERSLEQELSGYLLEHARRHDYALLTRPEVKLETDERLRLGEFGIQTRLVKPPARQGEDPAQGEEGHTMVYSVPPKQSRKERRRPGGRLIETKAIVTLTIAATCSTARWRCLGGRAPRLRVRIRTCRASTRSSAGARRATGRWSTWARRTASRSTTGVSTGPGCRPGRGR